MRKIYLDIEKSKKLLKLGEFTPKQCYDNIYENLSKLVSEEFINFDVKILFAYVSVANLTNIYTRHACFYIDGKAVDPTVLNVYKENLEKYNVNYLPIKILTIDEYMKLLSVEGTTDLFVTLSKIEKIRQKMYTKEGLFFIG